MNSTYHSAPSPENLESSALTYARQGWAVLPLQPKGKHPLTPHGVNDASMILELIERWWQRWPEANIGIAIPPGLAVLDLDSGEALHMLKAEDRVLPATVCSRTARGFHFWYGVPDQARNRVGILPGVDVRAAGGYVVTPPSIHPSGTSYRWKEPLERAAISDAPQWLMDLLIESESRPGRGAAAWAKTISDPVAAGRRNQALAEVAGLLFRRLPAEVAAEMALCWARAKLEPPLPDREVLKTLNSIARCELRSRGGKP